MKKLITLSLVFVMLMSVSALATSTRVLTMGNNNNILVDDANMWIYPGRTFMYPDLTIAEFSKYYYFDGPSSLGVGDSYSYNEGDDGFSAELYQLGVHWKFGEDNPFVVATYFSRGFQPMLPYPYIYNEGVDEGLWDDFPYGSFGGFDVIDEFDNRRINLFGGKQFNNVMGGVHLGLLQSSYSEENGFQEKESFTQFDIGVGLTEANGKWDVSANFCMGSWTNEEQDSTINEPDGYYDLMVMGRYFHQINQNYTYIPHVAVWMGKHGIKGVDLDSGEDATDQSKITSFDVGVGQQYTPISNVLAVLDFGFQYAKIKNEITNEGLTETLEGDYTRFSCPYWKLGVEAEVFDWADIRFGATSFWNSDKFEAGDLQEKWNTPTNVTYLGFGFNWGRLFIDTYTNPDLILDGFNFISGNGNSYIDDGDSVDMNLKVTILYEMY